MARDLHLVLVGGEQGYTGQSVIRDESFIYFYYERFLVIRGVSSWRRVAEL